MGMSDNFPSMKKTFALPNPFKIDDSIMSTFKKMMEKQTAEETRKMLFGGDFDSSATVNPNDNNNAVITLEDLKKLQATMTKPRSLTKPDWNIGIRPEPSWESWSNVEDEVFPVEDKDEPSITERYKHNKNAGAFE
jgi:hypothetical protein